MASLWTLVEHHLQSQAPKLLAPASVQRLLEAVDGGESLAANAASAPVLPVDPGPVQAALWDAIRPLIAAPDVPAPPQIGALPTDLSVQAYRTSGKGWEAKLHLPDLSIELPEDLYAPGTVSRQGTQTVVTRGAGTVTLSVPAPVLTVSAPAGIDPSLTIDPVTITLDRDYIALPFGFGLKPGDITVSPSGCRFAHPTFYLPRIPLFPLPELAAPDIAIDQMTGIQLPETEIDVPGALEDVLSAMSLSIDRPDARSMTDLIPSSVALTIPLSDRKLPLPNADETTATGGNLAFRLQFSASGQHYLLQGDVLADGGSAGGIATLDDSDVLALAGLLGPYLPGNAGGLAGLLASAAAADAIFPANGDTALSVHAVSLNLLLDPVDPGNNRIDVQLDYDVAMGFMAAAGPLKVRTRPGSPVRMRHRNVRLVLDDMPKLSWDRAQSTIVSGGDWEIQGIPPDVIRIADVIFQRGSLAVELDLRSALDIDFVTVEQCSVRVALSDAGGVSIDLPGFGVAVDIPGTITGRGQLRYDHDMLDVALAVSLPSIGINGRAALALAGDLVKLGVEVRLPVAIPFANSGLGLYALGGLLAINARRELGNGPGDEISKELAWNPMNPGSVVPGNQAFMGFAAGIGTVPDLGFAMMATGTVLIGIPDPLLCVTLEAELLRGMGGQMLGVLVVDDQALTIALKGEYDIPHLLSVEIPAGARFPYPPQLSEWEARLGGDRGNGRGEPVTVQLLPDLLDVEAWAFLMAFGDADTVVGAALKPPGIPAYGLSLAAGAGFDIHWETGPFAFHASAALLAVLTSRPKRPGETDNPWVLDGSAEIGGAVDLGPVSIGAHASLDVLIDTGAGTFYGDAEACASVDFFFFSIEGCVHFDIGEKPPMDIPAPGSPVLQLALTDRLGALVSQAAGAGGPIPTVWADAVPVLSFTHWVGVSDTFQGLGHLIADFEPDDGGWFGTGKLNYRFALEAITVTQIAPDGAETAVGSDWVSAWQLPIHQNVLGTTRTVGEARTLALNTVDPHHCVKPAVFAGENAPGDPVTFLKNLCGPIAGPGTVLFVGEDATRSLDRPMRVETRTSGLAFDDPRTLAFELETPDGFLPRGPGIGSIISPSPWMEVGVMPLPRIPLTLDGVGDISGFALVPIATEERGSVRFVLDHPAVDLTLYYLATYEQEVQVITSEQDDTSWDMHVVEPFDDDLRLFMARPRDDRPIDAFLVISTGPVGFAALIVKSAAAVERHRRNEANRQTTHDAIEPDAAVPSIVRTMLEPGCTYRVDIDLSWKGRGDGYSDAAGNLDRATFQFAVAKKATVEHRAAVPVPSGKADPWTALSATSMATATFDVTSIYSELASDSTAHAQQFDESILTTADLGRYVSGLVPANTTVDYFCADPVQASFVVDYLPELAAAYDSQVVIAVRRTRGADGDPDADFTPHLDLVIRDLNGVPGVLTPPMLTKGLAQLDVRRHDLAAVPGAMPPGCRVRFPGGGATSSATLLPSSEYRLTVNVLPGEIAPVAGNLSEGSEIAAGWFRTSRYRDPAELFASLGPTPAGTQALPAMPIPATADAAAIDPSTPFSTALTQLGIGNEPPSLSPQVHGLWIQGDPGDWALIGVLCESPEPIHRDGRCEVIGIDIGGVAAQAVLRDDRRTRLLAIVPPQRPDQPVPLTLHVRDMPPQGTSSEMTCNAVLDRYTGLHGVWV